MRKKLHKQVNPDNKTYDKYYITNYLLENVNKKKKPVNTKKPVEVCKLIFHSLIMALSFSTKFGCFYRGTKILKSLVNSTATARTTTGRTGTTRKSM